MTCDVILCIPREAYLVGVEENVRQGVHSYVEVGDVDAHGLKHIVYMSPPCQFYNIGFIHFKPQLK